MSYRRRQLRQKRSDNKKDRSCQMKGRTIMEKFQDVLMVIAGKMAANKYLGAVRDAFITNMPLVITGAFAVLFTNVICSPTNGLAQFEAFAFLADFANLFAPVNYATMNILALIICFLIGASLGTSNGFKGTFTGSLALASYFVFVPTVLEVEGITVTNVLARAQTDAQGLFLAIIVGLLSVTLYSKLMSIEALKVKMPDNVPPNVSEAFSALFPAMITLFGLGAVSFFFVRLTGVYVSTAINTLIQAPLQQIMEYPVGILVIVFVSQLLWCLGMHGSNITNAIRTPVLLASVAANMEAVEQGLTELPYIVSSPFWPLYCTLGGSGATIGLIIAIFIASKREDYKTIAKLSIPPGIFQINEPIIFGIPIVLNPMMMIPFILGPLVSATIGYISISIGFASRLYIEIPWTTPPLLNGFLASGGDIKTVITQLICIVALTLIYLPFVIMANKDVAVVVGEE